MKKINLPIIGKQDKKIVEIVLGLLLLIGVSQLGTIGCLPCDGLNIVNPLCQLQYLICLLGHASIVFIFFLLGLWLLADGIYDKFIR